MLKEKKNLPNSRVKLTITASAAQFQHAFDHELENIAKDVNLPGFRPGKAPKAQVLERVGRARVEAEAIEHVVADTYMETLQEAKLIPVEQPRIAVEKYEAPTEITKDDDVVVTYTAECDVIPEVKIDGYKKIHIKHKEQEPVIAEDEVTKVTDFLRKQRATLKEADKDTTLAMGMWADIGYEGSVKGVKRDDMKNEHHPLMLGDGQLIPGFEEQLVGMKVGEERTIHVTFPKEYHAKELAGQKAEFTVKLYELKNVELPVIDNAFAKEYGHDTVDALLKAIRDNLHQEKKEESRQKIEEEVLEQLLKLAKFETPKALVEQELERMYKESKERLSSMNFDWNTYLAQVKKTEEELREEMRPQAEKHVKIGLALGKLMEEEGLQDKEGSGRQAVDRLVEMATAK